MKDPFWCFVSQLHDYDMCIKKNEEALRIDPDFAECYGNMANAWKVNDIFYQQDQQNESNEWDDLMMNYLQEKGDIDLAIRFYCAAIEVSVCWFYNPQVTFRWILVSYISGCGFWYLQLRPRFCDAWSNLASAYMRKGMLREAEECCHQALAINPKLVIS